ncbi:unnamed protein product [Alopecurus aequalis]
MEPIIPPNSNNPMGQDSKKASGSTEYQLRNKLLLLATLVATVTYAAGLNLPGGVWQDTKDGHTAGDLILYGTHYNRYLVFYYCNATAFAASLVVCLLLLVLHSKSNKAWTAALRVVMVLDLLGLMGAYAAGSCRDPFTTIYSSVIMSAVFAYIVIAFSFYVFSLFAPANNEKGSVKQDESPENKEKGSVKQDESPEKREDQHEVLMLLATFVVTITYVAGLNPPGGFWSDTQDGHSASDPILQENNSSRYQAFFVCNTTAFVASLLIIILLLDKKLIISLPETAKKLKSVRFVALYGFIAIALLGLVGAYAAGSCRELATTTYVICLIVAVLGYIFLQVVITEVFNIKPGNYSCPTWLQKIRNFFAESENPTGTISREAKGNEALEKARNLVILLATLVASITYSAGLDPPGGLWQDDQDGHKLGDPILLTTHPTRYKVFFYSNSSAFVASLIVITMVQSRFLLKRHTLEAAMLLDLFGLIGAYAAGSTRDVSTSIYVVALAGAVLVYVVIHIVFFTLDEKKQQEDGDLLDKRREVLLLLAILVAALTYQAGLTPPGGFWPADDNLGHHAGFSVLLDNYPKRYRAFFYCNAISFMSSVALIVLLVNPNLYRPGIRCYALYVCMVAGMFGLMGAYAAGSSRKLRTSIYVLTLVAAVLAFVILQVVVYFWIQNKEKIDLWIQNRKIFRWIQNRKIFLYEFSNPENETSRKGDGRDEHPQTVVQITDTESTGQLSEEEKRKEKGLREYLMLLGVLAASVTYQTGLKPPGGLWGDSDNEHTAGNSILHDTNRSRYQAFFYSNSTSFMASIVVVVLLLARTLHKQSNKLQPLQLWAMHTAVLLNMLGLLVAYAAGSTRDWKTSRNVICLVIPVMVYFAAYAVYAAWLSYDEKKKKQHQIDEEKKKQGQIGSSTSTSQ